MIFCSTNNTKGRLGNAVMRIMSLMGIAKQNNTEWAIPKWKYAQYFENVIPQKEIHQRLLTKVSEPHFHYTPEFWAKQDYSKNIDIDGYLQSPKYWDEQLRFNKSYLDAIKQRFSLKENTLAVSVRRGDFVGNSNYSQIDINYYISAIQSFKDWQTRPIYFFSDDLHYCKFHFGALKNVTFVQGSDIEQLALMTLCDDFVISNSTFSYVGAYLANRGKVLRPAKNFAGKLAQDNDEKDYWPDNWEIWEPQRISAKDITFIIPVKYDSPDRKQNLDLLLCYLQMHFDANFIVGEQGGGEFAYTSQWCEYVKFDYKEFHRTKMLNEMTNMAETPFVFNYDCDVFLPPVQILETLNRLRAGIQFIYPYDGRCARVPRSFFPKIEQTFDLSVLMNTQFKGMGKDDRKSVGCAIAYYKDSFVDAGMENEHMISFGPEDIERYERFIRLGYSVERVSGPVYHLDHKITIDSGTKNPHFKPNWDELKREQLMSEKDLRDYVSTWDWAHKYSPDYYKRINADSIRSAEQVWPVLLKMFKPKSVIDLGCGSGAWGLQPLAKGLSYIGIDYGVIKQSLLIPEKNFINESIYQIETAQFPEIDIALCLEVAEHLEEKAADGLVDALTSLAEVIVFSAAIPGQGGKGHVNEQWQTWWAKKFARNSYNPIVIRDIRTNKNISVWYRQNLVVYCKAGKYQTDIVRDYVDPEMFYNVTSTLKAEVDYYKARVNEAAL